MTTQIELMILTTLRSMESLHNLKTSHLKKLAAIATEEQFPEGQIIYREGEVGHAIYLVKEGEVVIEMEIPDYDPVTVFTVGPGQLFGWSSLFPSRPKQARARVLKPTHAIVISANRLQDLFGADHKLEYAMMGAMTAIIADRVHTARLQLAKALASGMTPKNENYPANKVQLKH